MAADPPTVVAAPARVGAGLAPGGIVVRLYTPGGLVLLERRITPDDDDDYTAELAAADADAWFISGTRLAALVAYDGDTGRALAPPVLVARQD